MSRLFRISMVSMAIVMSTRVDHARAVETVFTDNVRIQVPSNPTLFIEQTGATPREWELGTKNNGTLFLRDATMNNIFDTRLRISPGAFICAEIFSNTFRIGTPTGTGGNVKLVLDGSTDTNQHIWTWYSGTDLTLNNTALDDSFNLINEFPFTIQQGAPTDSLFVSENGSIGMGTASPDLIGTTSMTGNILHLNLDAGTGLGRAIVQGQTGAESYLVHTGSPANAKIARARVFAGRYFISALKDDLTNGSEVFALCVNLATGNVGVKCLSPTKPFQVGGDGPGNDGNGAHVTIGGVWTNASSRTVKQDIELITSEQARETVRALQPVGYRYKNEPEEKYVGFVAEDVPELVATNDRKSLAAMDITAVLTRVVQDQERRQDELEQTVAEQRKLISEQHQLLSSQQAALTALTKRLADLERKPAAREATDSQTVPTENQ